MAEFDSGQLRQWAVKGAEQRLQEIAAEAAAIYQAFPELRDRSPRAAAPAAVVTAAAKRGRRGNMTAAQRKAVSERMRKYWAARREGAGGATSAGSAKAAPAARPGRAAKKTRGPRKMSAAARKRISDAQKKRWAQRRANG
jgi:hypothetical protein